MHIGTMLRVECLHASYKLFVVLLNLGQALCALAHYTLNPSRVAELGFTNSIQNWTGRYEVFDSTLKSSLGLLTQHLSVGLALEETYSRISICHLQHGQFWLHLPHSQTLDIVLGGHLLSFFQLFPFSLLSPLFFGQLFTSWVPFPCCTDFLSVIIFIFLSILIAVILIHMFSTCLSVIWIISSLTLPPRSLSFPATASCHHKSNLPGKFSPCCLQNNLQNKSQTLY